MTPSSVEVVLLDASGTDVTPLPRPHVFDTWYVPEGEVEVEAATASRLVLRMRPAAGVAAARPDEDEAPDVPVGVLPIVTLDPRTGDLTTVEVRLPTPSPFSDAGIDEMWQALSESPGEIRGYVRRRALWEGAGAAEKLAAEDLFVPGLAETVTLARHLMARWPQSEAVHSMWRPADIPGGREIPRETLRHIARVPVSVRPTGLVPLRTLRRRAATADWKLIAVAEVAAELGRRLQAGAIATNDLDSILTPIQAVAGRSQPESSRPDPPPSGWPWPLRYFYTAAIEALAAVIARQTGSGQAPLTHLWRLYEAWVAVRVADAVSEWRGRPCDTGPEVVRWHRGGPVWRATWEDTDATVEVLSQLNIGSTTHVVCRDVTVRSLTSELVPDVLVAVQRGPDVKVLVIDAKHTGDRAISPGLVASTGSKYLWGLRWECMGRPVDQSAAVIVSSGPPVDMFDPTGSRINSIQALPLGPNLVDTLELAARL